MNTVHIYILKNKVKTFKLGKQTWPWELEMDGDLGKERLSPKNT